MGTSEQHQPGAAEPPLRSDAQRNKDKIAPIIEAGKTDGVLPTMSPWTTS